MKCRKCNMKLKNDDMYCPNCGCMVNEKEKAGKKQWVVVLCAVVMVIVIGAVIVIYLFSGKKDPDTVPQESRKKTEIVEKQEEVAEDEANEYSEEQKDDKKRMTLALTAKPVSLAPYYRLSAEYAFASSVVEQEGYDNSADMVLDGKDATSWQEGVAGAGIGENITFSFDKAYKMKYMSFKLGNWRGDDYYAANHRPRTLQIIAGDYEQFIDFPDGKEEYWVEFSQECPVSEVKVVIQDVYMGNSDIWDDTCIAEIGMYGKE